MAVLVDKQMVAACVDKQWWLGSLSLAAQTSAAGDCQHWMYSSHVIGVLRLCCKAFLVVYLKSAISHRCIHCDTTTLVWRCRHVFGLRASPASCRFATARQTSPGLCRGSSQGMGLWLFQDTYLQLHPSLVADAVHLFAC